MFNVLELLELQQTIFLIRLELQKWKGQVCAKDAQIANHRRTNYRLRKELRLAKQKIEQLEKEQVKIAPEEFDAIYRKFYEHNLDHIENSPPVYQARVKVNLLGYQLVRMTDEEQRVDELIGLAMEYAYELAKETSRRWSEVTSA